MPDGKHPGASMKPLTNRGSRSSELSQPAVDPSQSNLWYVLLGIAVISLVSYVVYRPALNGEFVLDDELLTQDKLIKVSDGLYRLWFTTEPTDYWPVTSSSFWFEWRLFRGSPTGYHITNLVIHVVDCLLLWLLLKRLKIPGSFLAALIFAVHPVNVESVAWIAQRKNLLAMLFFLLSALSYFSADRKFNAASGGERKKSAWPWYLLSLLLFVFAMLSKGSVAVLPALLLLVIWWRRPLTKWDVARVLPFFVIGGLLVVLNVWFQTHGSAAIVPPRNSARSPARRWRRNVVLSFQSSRADQSHVCLSAVEYPSRKYSLVAAARGGNLCDCCFVLAAK